MGQSGGPAVAPSQQSTAGGSGDQPKKPRHPAPVNRKRTKTGCLTCRKRRIKCDEGRPTCNNCIKSKRICEGYNQRVIFKDPIGAHPFAGPFGSQGYIQGAAHPLQLASQQARRPGTTGLPTIAPRPPAYDYYNAYTGLSYQNPWPSGFPGSAAVPYDYNVGAYSPVDPNIQHRNPLAVGAPAPQPQPLNYYLPPSHDGAHPPQHPQFAPQAPVLPQYSLDAASGAFTPNPPGQSVQGGPTVEATSSLHAQHTEQKYSWSDDDASIADSDDDVDQHQGSQLMHMFQTLHNRGYQYNGPSYWNRSANDTTLGQYMSTPYADELKSEAKRKLFEHFMRVTGPTMSLYERHPFDPAEKREVSNNAQAPRDTKGDNIWTHTFPMLSLQHPVLLHAILALASLQVCHIQGTPATAAHKHYHVAIRRVAKNVKSDMRRLHPATLAATLLLCYFEVWNSEHTRWASHLYGARTLFAEIPLKSMGRRCLPAQSLRARQAVAQSWNFSGIAGALPGDPNALNFDLLTAIHGSVVRPDDYCLKDAQVLGQTHDTVTEKDIEKYENLRDLFWWYCKMDVYQTMLGGTKLFMDYRHWTQCPPRAPVSRLSGIYGTYDHLMLLLGRLSHFASNDLPRKRRVSRAKGPPPPGSSSPPPFPGMLPTQGTFRAPMGFSPPRTSNAVPDQQEECNPQESYQRALTEWESIKEAFEVLRRSLGPEFQPLGREYADPGDTTFGPSEQYRTFSVAGIWMNFYMGLIHLHRSHPSMPPTAMQSVGFAAHTTAVFAKRVGRIAIGLTGDLSKTGEVNTVLAAALVESAFCLFVAAVQYQDDAQRQWVVQWMHNITRLTGWKSARQIADGCESAWTKAAQLGKGPPYERQYEPHEMAHAEESVWDNARRIDRVIQEIDYDGGANDRRIVVARAERAHYALGLLGVEDDMEYLELKDETFNRGSERTGQDD